MKGGKYTKTLAKIWVEGIIRIRDIRGNVLIKFIELCMETPCWSSSGWAPTWRTESNRKVCYRVLLQKREFTPRGTHKHLSNTFSNALNCLDSKIPRKKSLLKPKWQLSRPSCKCCVTQKLRNSSVLYYKTKNPFEAKICLKISFQLL